MAIRLVSVSKNSVRTDVSFQVLGNPGELVDCQGVLLGQGQMNFSPVATTAQIAAAILARAAELYAEGYEAWTLRNELAPLL